MGPVKKKEEKRGSRSPLSLNKKGTEAKKNDGKPGTRYRGVIMEALHGVGGLQDFRGEADVAVRGKKAGKRREVRKEKKPRNSTSPGGFRSSILPM